MNPTTDYDKVKADIIQAAGEVFLKYGFIRVSMQDISKASGKGRSTLYYYFKNKEEVLDAFAMEIFSEMLDKSRVKMSPDAAFTANLDSYYRTKLTVFRRLLKQYNLLIEDIKIEPALFLNKMDIFFKKEVIIIQQLINWAVDKKDIAALSPTDTVYLSETLVTAFQSFEQGMLLFGKFSDFEDRLTWLTQILAKGLK